jgi:hypothetical protein
MVRATIQHRDALSRRVARAINAILETHADADAADFRWHAIRARFLDALGALSDALQARGLVGATHAADLQGLLAAVGRQLGPARPALATLTEAELRALEARIPVERPAVACPSSSLLDARRQHAELRTRLLDLQARIRPAREIR